MRGHGQIIVNRSSLAPVADATRAGAGVRQRAWCPDEAGAHPASRRCTGRGHVAAESSVTQAVFRCLACGDQAHADISAARNILGAGLALQETHNVT